jgi:hypothetical protein
MQDYVPRQRCLSDDMTSPQAIQRVQLVLYLRQSSTEGQFIPARPRAP